MTRPDPSPRRSSIGLGFLPEEARHGFLIDVPRGSGRGDLIAITEHRGDELDALGCRTIEPPAPNDPALRVLIDRARWALLAPDFWDEANRTAALRACDRRYR